MGLENQNEEMIQKLIENVFEKAKKESQQESAYGLTNHLEKAFELTDVKLTRSTFERYHVGYILNGKKIKPNKETKDALSTYLGYTNYLDFCTKNTIHTENSSYKKKLVWSVFANILLFLCLLLCWIEYQEKECMLWMGDHYEKVKCKGLANEKPLEEDVLKLFKKVEVCKDSTFFVNGIPIIHYTRHNNVTEFFTSNGAHPIYHDVYTDPITQRIIQTRVKPCDVLKYNELGGSD